MNPFQPLIAAELHDNWQAFLDINGLADHSTTLDHVMIFGANDLIVLLPLLLLIGWLLLAQWSPFMRWLVARWGADVAERDRWLGQRALLSGVVAVVIALCLNILLGAAIYEPRPFISHPGVDHQLIPHPADASFPSDHEAVAMAIALALVFYAIWLLWRVAHEHMSGGQRRNANLEPPRSARRLRVAAPVILAVVALLAALFIGFARVFVGVHYPVDIVGGAVCGLIGAALAFGLLPLTQRAFQPIASLAGSLRLA